MSKIIIKLLSIVFKGVRNIYEEQDHLKETIKRLSDENLKLICNIKELELMMNKQSELINSLKDYIGNRTFDSNVKNDGVINEEDNKVVIDSINDLF